MAKNCLEQWSPESVLRILLMKESAFAIGYACTVDLGQRIAKYMTKRQKMKFPTVETIINNPLKHQTSNIP